MYISVSTHECSPHRGQKSALDPLEQELLEVVNYQADTRNQTPVFLKIGLRSPPRLSQLFSHKGSFNNVKSHWTVVSHTFNPVTQEEGGFTRVQGQAGLQNEL